MSDKLIINLALTGMVARRSDNPALPETAEEIAADCARCADAGVSIVHIHARDDGEPTHRREIYAGIIAAIRRRCPDLLICVSCSGRTQPELDKRAEVLQLEGAEKPDLASLTLGSMNFPAQVSANSPATIVGLAETMARCGITPELEAFEVGMIDYARSLIDAGVLRRPYHFNLFFGSRGSLALSPLNLGTMLAALPAGATWAAAGIGRHQLNANVMAIAAGGHVRLGLEDNLFMDAARTDPATNLRLVERLATIARSMGREPATAAEARAIIGLPARP